MTSRPLVRFATTALAVALLFPASSAAQGITAGIKGGPNVSNVTFKVPDGSLAVDPDSRTGLTIGGFVAKDFTATAGLVIEGFFSHQSTDFDFTDGGVTVNQEVRVNYVTFPILGRVNLRGSGPATVHVFGGPSFAFKASHSVKQMVNGVEQPGDTEPDITGHDVGLVLGMSVDIKTFVIDGRYTWGFVNLNTDTGSDEPVVKNRTFAILFGLNLWNKR
jgi:outer membrane protein with beta-barrel domain